MVSFARKEKLLCHDVPVDIICTPTRQGLKFRVC